MDDADLWYSGGGGVYRVLSNAERTDGHVDGQNRVNDKTGQTGGKEGRRE